MMGDLNSASAYDSAYAILILKAYDGEQGISILTDLNWSKDGAVLAELSYRVAQYGLSIRVIDQIEYEKFAAQRNALVSIAAAHLGYAAADRLLNGPDALHYAINNFCYESGYSGYPSGYGDWHDKSRKMDVGG